MLFSAFRKCIWHTAYSIVYHVLLCVFRSHFARIKSFFFVVHSWDITRTPNVSCHLRVLFAIQRRSKMNLTKPVHHVFWSCKCMYIEEISPNNYFVVVFLDIPVFSYPTCPQATSTTSLINIIDQRVHNPTPPHTYKNNNLTIQSRSFIVSK